MQAVPQSLRPAVFDEGGDPTRVPTSADRLHAKHTQASNDGKLRKICLLIKQSGVTIEEVDAYLSTFRSVSDELNDLRTQRLARIHHNEMLQQAAAAKAKAKGGK